MRESVILYEVRVMNDRPMLSTGTREVAERYAQALGGEVFEKRVPRPVVRVR
jgi:hypothetical protein